MRFASGEKRLFDTTAAEGLAFEPLRQGIAPETVSVFHGFLAWLDGRIDLAPNTSTSTRSPTTRCRRTSRTAKSFRPQPPSCMMAAKGIRWGFFRRPDEGGKTR